MKICTGFLLFLVGVPFGQCGIKEDLIPAAVAYFEDLDENSSLCQEIATTFLSYLSENGLETWDKATQKAIIRFREVHDSAKLKSGSEACTAAKDKFQELMKNPEQSDIILESLLAFVESTAEIEPCSFGIKQFLLSIKEHGPQVYEDEGVFEQIFSASSQQFIMASMEPTALYTKRCSNGGMLVHKMFSDVITKTMKLTNTKTEL